MDRRKFFSFLPALATLPAICKNLAEKPTRFWAGTIIPRATPWEELAEAQKRVVAASGAFTMGTSQGYQYSYFFVNSQGQVTAPTPLPTTVDVYRWSDG